MRAGQIFYDDNDDDDDNDDRLPLESFANCSTLWSNGYIRRLITKRVVVQIPAQD